uniref:ABC transporter domain-containing protein n=1 Tax=Beta vulgaris TaxID=161934 RepID=E2DMY7_BETVU|nr:hypothetical protein [Beta vulgaris]
MDDFIHVSLYEISSNPVMGFLVFVVEISFSSMGVVSVVVLFLGMRNCSCWLKFKSQHEGIGISDAVNMARSRRLFPNYVRMIDFLINSCLIQQIQGGCAVLLDLVHYSFFEDEFDLTLNLSTQSENYAIWGQNLNFSIKTKQGGSLPILKNCSIQIPSGQLWMLLGPNGCGKSTLLKILAGLLKPTDGSVYVKKPKSFVFQNPDHQVVMPTVEADVAFGLGKFDLTYEEVKSKVAKALDAVGMSEYSKRQVQTLSGGQKQRVAIAGALAETCQVLLLDELTTFLDESDQVGVIKAVKNSLTSSGEVTALWVTHRLEELEYADGAIYMEDGRVVKNGDPSAILDFINRQQALYIEKINS